MRKYMTTWQRVGAEFEAPGPERRLVSATHEVTLPNPYNSGHVDLLCVWESCPREDPPWITRRFDATKAGP